MINKLIIIVLLGILGALIGSILGKKLKEKTLYYCDLVDFCEKVIADVRLDRYGIDKVIEGFSSKSEPLKKDINGYKAKKVFEPSAIAGKNRELLVSFFESISSFDEYRQIEVLKSKKEEIKKIADSLVTRLKKEYSAYVKLGFLFGISVGVLMI